MNNFRNTGRLMRDGDPITEWESNAKDFPKHVGKLYIEGNWFTVEQARELHDFLNQILPYECDLCGGSGFRTIHIPGNEGVPEWDADDQPCHECNENYSRVKVAP
jgi:hypothetical protein